MYICCNVFLILSWLSSGGFASRHDIVEYNIVTDEIIDLGVDYLNVTLGNDDGEFGYSKYFTQINGTTMYTINGNTGSINVYNLKSSPFYELDTTIPIDVYYYGCIASSDTPSPRLYIS